MKTLADVSFFRAFDALLAETNPGMNAAAWQVDDVRCTHERHSFSGREHRFAIEVVTVANTGRRGWTLMVVKEYWWARGSGQAVKVLRWARPIAGSSGAIVAWFRARTRDDGLRETA